MPHLYGLDLILHKVTISGSSPSHVPISHCPLRVEATLFSGSRLTMKAGLGTATLTLVTTYTDSNFEPPNSALTERDHKQLSDFRRTPSGVKRPVRCYSTVASSYSEFGYARHLTIK